MKNDQLSSVLKQQPIPIEQVLESSFHGLTKEDQDTLRKMLAEINQDKFSVGDIDLQLAILEAKKTELIQKLHSNVTQLNLSVNKLAEEVGINLNSPHEKWNIDLTATEIGFKRVG